MKKLLVAILALIVSANMFGYDKITTPYGYIDFGPYNVDWAHIITDRPTFHFNKGISADSGHYSSYDDHLFLDTAHTTRLMIHKDTGNVGIGTTMMAAKLHVREDSGFLAKFEGIDPNKYSEIQVHSNSGFVGIGSIGSNYPGESLKNSSYIYSTGKEHFYLKSTGNLIFSTGGTQMEHNRMIIDKYGSVGIGTTTPHTPFHVYGTTTVMAKFQGVDPTKFSEIHTFSDTGVLVAGSSGSSNSDVNFQDSNYIYSRERDHFQIKSTGDIRLHTGGLGLEHTRMTIDPTGKVGIGTAPAVDAILAVSGDVKVVGTITAKKINVVTTIAAADIKIEKSDEWADFVFADDYNLRTIEEVESFIGKNGHLPEMPTAGDVAENGYSLAEVNSKLLQKIEELTLYTIELNKKVKDLEDRL